MVYPVEPNYFTCTLGEASRWKEMHPDSRSFSSVIDLVDKQAQDHPQLPAVGFSVIERIQVEPRESYLTFSQLSAQSHFAASRLESVLPREPRPQSVGLICTSSFEFILTWLGLTRLGLSVLLLAPQLEAKAIRHLCETLSVRTIFTDALQEGRCAAIREHLNITRIPNVVQRTAITNGVFLTTSQGKGTDSSEVAIWFHSSGTSTGLPKAIPQTHGGLVAALPSFPCSDQPATFSTTPLYHGGLVDALRAWSSGAMTWFFPESEAPITASNVQRGVAYAQDSKIARVGYFSSVPYIIQMLADDPHGFGLLKIMDLVGVGGAALPEVTGNSLVQQGVRLVSRMGSAECGFLMSSHRDYSRDDEWQFLRPIDDPSFLAFESRDDGLSELVVKAKWPHLAKVNREDGSYATSDLFEPHQHRSGLWRYHSRADAQITLSNGKKFDPSPLEASILASSSLLRDVLIFGDGRDYPGILLFPCGPESANKIIESTWNIIRRLNSDSQNHARISKSMMVLREEKNENGLQKSSKGTILRRQAETRFAKEIEGAYLQRQDLDVLPDSATHDELHSAVIRCFTQVLGRLVDPEQDLYGQGVDSISCIQIRSLIQASCLQEDSVTLPRNVVYDKATIKDLISYLWELRQNSVTGNASISTSLYQEDDREIMKAMAAKYTQTLSWTLPLHKTTDKVIVLTGATGFLGSHILRLLLDDNQVQKIICLVRASSEAEAQDRLEATLRLRGCAGQLDHRIVCVPSILSREDLGLRAELQALLATKTALFIHSAWTVNFSLQISSFEDQISGTANMLKLAAQVGALMVFISSTAAVSQARNGTIPEDISDDPRDASPLGYSQSKWVAEKICAAAATRRDDPISPFPQQRAVVILRVGQLCGDERGIWNKSEAYPLMLSTARIIGSLPDIKGEVINWLPVHLAAQIVIDIAFQSHDGSSLGEPRVFHVFNYHDKPSWNQMLLWLQADSQTSEGGPSFEVLPPSRWVSALETAAEIGEQQHPAYALLGLWKLAFSATDVMSDGPPVTPRYFDTTRSRQNSPAIRALQPLDREHLLRMWRWVHKTLS
ncbi:hypothetical protein NLU13_0129 [Sarocladium strictum]|uniref:Carrier domain-containing protein n=1 Tax=Sarocladium strictum TaxID=5046 RepID=A0AA39GNH1_SARSR|nr:hypothetical protein NLU13_0129 [Sarocladium strictum]